jgi:purine-binding chemotaxis protein CheW
VQALIIPVDADWYALDLRAVREVLARPDPTPLPGAPPAVRGLINLRGMIVPLLDLSVLLGLGPMAAPYAAVAETAGGLAALTASALPATAQLEDLAGPAERPAAVARFATDGGGVATLLDLDELMELVRA